MNTKVEQSQQAASPADVAKYVLAAAVLVASFYAFYYFGQWPGPLRGLVIAAGVVAAVAFKIVDLVIGLRVAEDQEREGLDTTAHGETAYRF